MQPKINNVLLTVLMPVYNTDLNQLDSAIQSVLDQTYRDFEFLIIDDGSDQLVKDYLENIKNQDKRITLIHNEKNMGLTYTLNRGLALAKTQWVARMDSDDWSYPDRFERQMDYLSHHGHLVVLGTLAQVMDTGKLLGMIEPPYSYNEFISCLPYYCCLTHPTVILNREKIMAIGGYPNYRYAEDYALWSKILFESDYQMQTMNYIGIRYRVDLTKTAYFKIQSENTQAIIEQSDKKLKLPCKLVIEDLKEKSKDQLLQINYLINLKYKNIIERFPNCDKDYLNFFFYRDSRLVYQQLKMRSRWYIFAYKIRKFLYKIYLKKLKLKDKNARKNRELLT